MQLSLITLFLSPVMLERSAAVRHLRSFNSTVKASTACTRCPPIYAQLYFYDLATAADLRSNRNQLCLASYFLGFLLCVINITNSVVFTATQRKASIRLRHHTRRIEFS